MFAEESIYRGFVVKRGSEQFNQISAVFISSYFFCFSVLYYRINFIQIGFSPFYPLIWFFLLFIIGLILSLFTLRKKWLFPAILSHSVSNIVMLLIVWCFLNGWDQIEILLVIFFPLIGIGLIILIFQYDRIKEGVLTGLKMLKEYIKNDQKEKEIKSDKNFRIFLDLIIGFFIFIIGFLITI
ncbi:MAG: CPBP family intramembrane metalloprotease [Candidatus Lokiarchaeota archaeon]|nr:CPBP family intramembrane metalloprotease [Candidatus Lokiarchaeota archaeon]